VQADPIPARAKTNSTGSPPLVCSATGHSEILSNRYFVHATLKGTTVDMRPSQKSGWGEARCRRMPFCIAISSNPVCGQ